MDPDIWVSRTSCRSVNVLIKFFINLVSFGNLEQFLHQICENATCDIISKL